VRFQAISGGITGQVPVGNNEDWNSARTDMLTIR
jgi:hypothetical protein